jgi:DUF2934 family protein
MLKPARKAQLVQAKKPVKIVPIQNLSERTRKLHDSIERRAYELYESRGREPDHELDDRRRAESEVLFHLGSGN